MREFEFSFDEVIKSLNELSSEDPDGFTSFEMASSLGCSQNWANKLIRDLVRNGVSVYAGKKTVIKVDGNKCKVPVYKMVKK